MKIREYELDVNILEEVEEFEWVNGVVRGNKFLACSPFRSERHPSFAINLETSTWIDSGNSDEFYHKGNLVKLLAVLRQEDIETVEDYLIEKYATILADTEALVLNMNLPTEEEKPVFIERSTLKHLYVTSTDYFTNRGISLDVQQLFGLGYNSETRSVAMLWTDNYNNIINIKYRNIDKKAFFYAVGGQRITNYVFGIYQCIRRRATRVYICESEIDALTLWSHGYPAVAVGGSSLSDSQRHLILTSGITELVIATDNDKVGNRFRETIQKDFGGILTMFTFTFPEGVKDVNDMTWTQLSKAVQTLETPIVSFLNLSI